MRVRGKPSDLLVDLPNVVIFQVIAGDAQRRWGNSGRSRWSAAISAASTNTMPLHVEILYNEYSIWASTGHAAAVFGDELYDILPPARVRAPPGLRHPLRLRKSRSTPRIARPGRPSPVQHRPNVAAARPRAAAMGSLGVRSSLPRCPQRWFLAATPTCCELIDVQCAGRWVPDAGSNSFRIGSGNPRGTCPILRASDFRHAARRRPRYDLFAGRKRGPYRQPGRLPCRRSRVRVPSAACPKSLQIQSFAWARPSAYDADDQRFG